MSLDSEFLERMKRALSQRRDPVRFEKGLTDGEIADIEKRWSVVFPPDLRRLLQFALPVTPEFIDWRNGDPAGIEDSLDWPRRSICFDVEHADFWWEDWGSRPDGLDEALKVAAARISMAPKLIPVYGHRYLPSDPPTEGNPVFSVYQTDVICYGRDLQDWIQNEFYASFDRKEAREAENVRYIGFWSDLVEANRRPLSPGDAQ